jgi:filamentous hemagglutinin
LLPQDLFSIGGRQTVRGFDGNSVLSGDQGWLVRQEISTDTLQASQGPLEVSQDGWLSNAGSLRANQTLNIRTTGKIDNSGSAYAAGAMEIVSGGTQTHSGVTAALGSVHLQTSGDPKADIVSTPQALIAAGIQADGKFIQAQPLNLQADGQVQLAGETLTMWAAASPAAATPH